MKLEVFGPADSTTWNNIIDNSINGTLYHSWEWLKIAEKHSETKLFPLVYFDGKDEKPFGAIPLFYMKKWGLRFIFCPPPRTSITLGPVFVDKAYSQHKLELAYIDFYTQVEKFIESLHPVYTFILTSPGLLDVRPFSWGHYDVTPFYTYMLDLRTGTETVWNNLSRSLKEHVKRAARQGISVEESRDIDDINKLYYALKERYAQQRINLPLTLDYLRDLYHQFHPSGLKVYQAMHEGKIASSAIGVMYKDTAISWQGGYRNGNGNSEVNELLAWESISRASQNGYKSFEIEGANSQHLCDFKSRFCPTPVIYFMMKKSRLLGTLAEKAYFAIYKPV
jgi:lipid II:glycine glycyltransferase (peptidoglycan interpeptide bridge formation enzyme)